MAINDIFSIFIWWGFLFGIGIVFFPLTKRLFSHFVDEGYVFSKIIGVVIITYITLLFGFLHIAQLSRPLLFGVLLLVFILLYRENVVIRKGKIILQLITFSAIRKRWKVFLFEEILVLLGIFFLAYIRSFSPDIHGLEKYMDFGFMNSILNGNSFPPKDMWLTPYAINYYYFGHFYSAMLMKLTAIAPTVSYNLILATVFSLTFTGAFSLGASLYSTLTEKSTFRLKTIFAGILSGFFVTLSGNLHIIYSFFAPYENEHPVPLWRLLFQPLAFPNSYWYPNATRFIHNTIHEFPMYSWIVADLHGHVLDMPIVMLTIALLFSFLQKARDVDQKMAYIPAKVSNPIQFIKRWGSDNRNFLFVGLLLAIMYMTNAWDGLIYLLLAAIVYLLVMLHQKNPLEEGSTLRKYSKLVLTDKKYIFKTLYATLVTFAGFLVFSFPFSLHFKPFVSGIGIICSPDFLLKKVTAGNTTTYDVNHLGPFLFEPNHCLRSPLWQLLVLYGFFLFFGIVFILLSSRIKRKTAADYFIFAILILSTLLIILPEFVYVKDIYPDHYRANTMFKLVFQSFIMLSLMTGYTVIKFTANIKQLTKSIFSKLLYAFLSLGITLLLTLVFIYPHLGVLSYYGDLKTYVGLDGMKYLQAQYPDDYEAILWLQKNVAGLPVVLEAQGDSYTDYARVSANTGLPTVLGWTVHEWLWRGSYGLPDGQTEQPGKIYDVPAPRIAEIQTLYETVDLNEAKRLLKKYAVQYVFIGDLEFQKYPKLDESKFTQLGTIVFQKGKTKIYKISPL